MRRDARRLRRVPADVLILALALALALPANALARRPIPDTSAAVHVWDDQLPDSMTDAQVRFVARHVDGTQKVSRQTASRLRATDPGFLVLHYRLGIGDGPVPFRIGDKWASDYGSVTRHESWFWHQDGRRVFQSQWGWYLMNPDSGWRSYWARRVLYESSLLGDDGVFADSLSVPQYLGAASFSPPLQYFVGEAAWTARIDRFMRYEERRLHGRLWFIPNAGSWITTRDRTNYAIPDGVMIEGFAEGGPASFYAPVDWRLEMNRALGLVRRGKVLIAQSYLSAGDRRARGFVLGSYLLIKGSHTFVNMDIGSEPQWFPEYGVDLGPALTSPPSSIDALRAAGGLYVRRYARGLVAVNPDGRSHVLALPRPARRVEPIGGGAIGAGADTQGWRLRLVRVRRRVVLPAHSGLVLISSGRA
ncbi:MAG TPA: putative glycoside hydrolase [Solirubrobacteraceae bacterium]|nr:putative glycoside hydrolase [Solirubrobacteraceae bacterium]